MLCKEVPCLVPLAETGRGTFVPALFPKDEI